MWDLVPWPGIEPGSPTLGMQSLDHWTIRKVYLFSLFLSTNVSINFFWSLWIFVLYSENFIKLFCICLIRFSRFNLMIHWVNMHLSPNIVIWGFSGGSVVKNPPANAEDWVWSLGWEELEEETATHSSILAWEIPWTEEPGGLQSTGLQRVEHDLVTKHSLTHCDFYLS